MRTIQAVRSPWGKVEDAFKVGPEIMKVSTPSHGGLRVTGDAQRAISDDVWDCMINGRGWAEEDCEEAIILALLLWSGHITNPHTLAHATLILDTARDIVAVYGRYRSITIPTARPSDAETVDVTTLQPLRDFLELPDAPAVAVPTVAYYVNEYRTDRARGGPEEGGWYYDTGEYVKCHGVHLDRAAAEQQAVSLAAYLDNANEGLHSPGSVLSEGDWSALYIEEHPGEDFPTERPRYE